LPLSVGVWERGTRMLKAGLVVCSMLFLVQAAWAGHTLRPSQGRVLATWLSTHPKLRAATNADCACDDEIEAMRHGFGGKWAPVKDYQPYVATGDFNGDGIPDFAVVVLNESQPTEGAFLLVFNGPLESKPQSPAVVLHGLDRRQALFFGPPRPRPYRLVLGPFESEGAVLEPHGHSYSLAPR